MIDLQRLVQNVKNKAYIFQSPHSNFRNEKLMVRNPRLVIGDGWQIYTECQARTAHRLSYAHQDSNHSDEDC